MAFKNGNNQPRNRSTNYLSLSNRITSLQREMNPAITCSGSVPSSNQKMYITRRVTAYLKAANGSVAVTAAALAVTDGAKILSVKIHSINGRILTIEVPNGTTLVVNDGNTTAPFGGFRKTTAAPLSQFPSIKVNIPDLLAAPLNKDSTETLFNLTSEVLDNTFRVVYTAKYLA